MPHNPERGERFADPDYSPPPELHIYRRHTTYLLHRYFRMAIEVGRLPSLLGREFFRARVSHQHRFTFEDAVIFVHDVERCLERLDGVSRALLACVVFQDYSLWEAARILRCGLRSVERRFPQALDRISEMFLEKGILWTLPLPVVEAVASGDVAELPPDGVESICAQAELLGDVFGFPKSILVVARACQAPGTGEFSSCC